MKIATTIVIILTLAIGTAAGEVEGPGPQPPATTTSAAGFTPLPLVAAACCKHCSSGKACGNSCIARNKTCRKGPGCACD